MKYIFLAAAIVFEVIGSTLLKVSDGFSKIFPTMGTLLAYLISFYLFSLALRAIPLGMAYAVWAGMGIILTALVSVILFKENLDFPAVLGILMIVGGVVLLNFFSKTGKIQSPVQVAESQFITDSCFFEQLLFYEFFFFTFV